MRYLNAVHNILWLFLALFGVNTLENLVLETTPEKFFALVTLALALLLWLNH
ncbi:MAG: hypothetical protein HKN53_12730 [Maribacter sp.]|nr:hypothetical protein [Maribacter sp.]